MSDLVRVRLANGHETNVGREHAANSGLAVLDEPTHRGDGTTRPATRQGGRPLKPHTSVSEEAAKRLVPMWTFPSIFTAPEPQDVRHTSGGEEERDVPVVSNAEEATA